MRFLKEKYRSYFNIFIIIILIFAFIFHLSSTLVGDGAEYYALFYAWKETVRPWMTLQSFDAYSNFIASKEVAAFTSREQLEKTFEMLKVNQTQDFNHFWFYSFSAYLFSKTFSLIGIDISAHNSFLFLHFGLLFLTASIAYRYHKLAGVVTFFVMTFASPIVWYLNKAHTEVFTFTLTVAAVIVFISNRYFLSALFFAIGSTQNPSFAILALIALMYGYFTKKEKHYTTSEVILTISSLLIILLHPAYYFFRFGVVTPQLLAGGASLGGHFSSFYMWIVDPDLGLLPNWPLGLAYVLMGIYFLYRNSAIVTFRQNVLIYLFLICFFFVNAFAHASTTNVNSGATPGLARYALWYMPIMYPIIMYVNCKLIEKKLAFYVFILPFLALAIINLKLNNPEVNDDCGTPSSLSFFLQKYMPWVYDPPAEVFSERYSGVGERVLFYNPRGIIGPDCKKILVYPGEGRNKFFFPSHCMYDETKLNDIVGSSGTEKDHPYYIQISEDGLKSAKMAVSTEKYSVGGGSIGNFILASGWNPIEAWGVWSSDKVATLHLPCNSNQFYRNKDKFILTLRLAPFNGSQGIKIFQMDRLLVSDVLHDVKHINIVGNANACESGLIKFEIYISDPISPHKLGLGSDRRNLGISLTEFYVSLLGDAENAPRNTE